MPSFVAPTVFVDWTNDGNFTGPYDDITCDVASDPGVTIDTGMDVSQVGRPPMVPAAEWEVYNETAKYSPESASSPLYQQIVPGRPIAVMGAWGNHLLYRRHTVYRAHTAYRGYVHQSLAQGQLTAIAMTTALGHRRVRMSTIGLTSKLRGRTISVPIQTTIRTDQALALVLDAAGWPAGARALSIGDTTLDYWWLDERDAWDAAAQLLASEGPGALYEDGDGVLHFENRGYRSVQTRSTVSRASYFDQSGSDATPYRSHKIYRGHSPYRGRTSGLWFTDLRYEPSYGQVVNRATYSTRRRTLLATGKVWEYGATLTLGPSQTTTLIARPSQPFLNAVAPAAGTHYTVTAGSATVTLTYSSGAVAFIVVAAGGAGATITGASGSNGLQLAAQSLAVASESIVQSTVDVTSSVARFGTRSYDVGGWPELASSAAEGVCNAIVTRRSVQRAQVAITVHDVDTAHVDEIVRRMVSDRVTVVDASSGMHTECYVEHKAIALGRGPSISMVMTCEKVQEVGGSIWDGPNIPANQWDTAVWAD